MIWRGSCVNTANKLTISRIIMIPLFIVFALMDGILCKWLTLITFIVASVTDFADGYIARKHNLVTDFGKFLDPLADKLLVMAALCILTDKGDISVWVVFIITAREFIVTGLRLVAAGDGVVIAASMWGKVKTVTQMIVIIYALAPLNFAQDFVVFGMTMTQLFMWIVAVITVISGADYVIKNKNVLKG